jgi:hypothetical protein
LSFDLSIGGINGGRRLVKKKCGSKGEVY